MTDASTPFENGLQPLPAEQIADETRKPRFAIMGEFSAGKSTLSNLLIGTPALPVKVTATQLPPVWISYGDQPAYRVAVDGTESPFDFNDLSDISLEDTMCLRVFHKSDALELCDLIDMPGISDPNMASEVWERALHLADGVIWCTHATQAWRQSEAAVWSTVNPDIYAKSLLLLTRIDKIMSERDRLRVARRVEKEVSGLFAGVFPISLTDAIEAEDDHDLWQKSGAEAFAIAMIDIVETMSNSNTHTPVAEPAQVAEHLPPKADDAAASILTLRKPLPAECDMQPKVIPQRITRSSAPSQRPPRPARRENAPPTP